MGRTIVTTLRVLLLCSAAGSVALQVVLLAVAARGRPAAEELTGTALLLLGIGCAQVVMACTWRLLTLVRRGQVFSVRAFGYVDTIAVAIGGAAVVLVALGALLAPGPAAPGLVLLLGCAGAVTAGVALLVVVMRTLLAQAVATAAEAGVLRSELEGLV